MSRLTRGLTQVSTVVQTNAATAEESSASSEELDAQAQILKQEVEKFRLQGEHTPAARESVRYEAAATVQVPEYNDTEEYTTPADDITPVTYIHDSAKY